MDRPDAAVVAALQAERAQHLALLGALRRAFTDLVTAAEGSNVDDEHDPEGATIAFERSQLAAQVARTEAAVTAAEDALRRARDGGYGVCQSCGQPIAPERLEARPTATTCITCAR